MKKLKKPNLRSIHKEHGFHVSYRLKRRYVFFLSVLLALMIYLFKDAGWILRALTAATFLFFFYVVDHVFNLKFRHKHYLFMLIITATSLLLSPVYYIHPQYDKLQHLVLPIFVASIIFYMISRLDVKARTKLTICFFITIGILGLFEIGEYTLDTLFDLKLQGVYLRDHYALEKLNLVQNKIGDTMIDMILGVVGSGVYCIAQYVIQKRKEKHAFAH